jgi:phosphatidylserine/phosphatidylglycerophosphate/cardiolipin synthase-like enzyme
MRTLQLRQLLPPRFPWRDGNQFELLVDGEQFFPHMLDAIHRARHSIALEMYLVSSGQVFTQVSQALLDAAARGVHIRVLLDDFGAKGLSLADRQAFAVSNIEVLFFNRLRWRQGVSNLLRNHRKLLLVDRELGYVGGAGLTDEFMHTHGTALPWHELMLAIRGPAIDDWVALFERTWFGMSTRWFKQRRAPHTAPVSGAQRGRVCASNGPRAHHVAQSLYQHLQQSRQRIWLVTPYFLPSLKLRRLLIQAARRHVDVRVLVPGELTDHPAIRHASRRHYARLLRGGVRIFEYQPRFIHAKLALCDDWASIGSTNFDRWNLHWNLDANQEIDDPVFALQAQHQLEQDFALSEELHYASWEQRPLYLRCLEWLNGRLDRLLDRLHR